MTPITNSRPIEILLVEDSATDVLLAREALEYSKLLNNLHVVANVVRAIDQFWFTVVTLPTGDSASGQYK